MRVADTAHLTQQKPPTAGSADRPTTADAGLEAANWLNLPEVAERLEVPITKVHQMIRDGVLLAARRDGTLAVPGELVANAQVRKHLPGVITLLRDAGYGDDEALRWLYTPDATLPGTPAAALGGARATEVKRRAQALGF